VKKTKKLVLAKETLGKLSLETVRGGEDVLLPSIAACELKAERVQ